MEQVDLYVLETKEEKVVETFSHSVLHIAPISFELTPNFNRSIYYCIRDRVIYLSYLFVQVTIQWRI